MGAPITQEIEEIIEQYSNMVYRLAFSRMQNKQDSEDVFQEVFLKLAKNMSKIESQEHLKAWLIRVTINCSKNILKSGWFKNTTNLKEKDILFEDQDKQDIYYAVVELPEKYRIIIHLFYYEGLKVSEISRILQLKEATIKTRLARAREKLKAKLKKEEMRNEY